MAQHAVGEWDRFCASRSRSCNSCLDATGLHRFANETSTVRCQWVVGDPGLCIALTSVNATAVLSDWIAARLNIGDRRAKPSCRRLVREVSRCEAESEPQSAAATECVTSAPSCGICTVRGDLCGFCGESDIVVSDGAGFAPARCIAAVDVRDGNVNNSASSPCSTRCRGEEHKFHFSRRSDTFTAQGVIEYPLWGRHGITYAPNQRCSWSLVGEVAGNVVTASLTHQLAQHDALIFTEGSMLASGLAGRQHAAPSPPRIVGAFSETPLMLSFLSTPLTIEFQSNSQHESYGFVFHWGSQLLANSSGSVNRDVAISPPDQTSRDVAHADAKILILWVVMVSGVVVSICFMFDGARRCYRYKMKLKQHEDSWAQRVGDGSIARFPASSPASTFSPMGWSSLRRAARWQAGASPASTFSSMGWLSFRRAGRKDIDIAHVQRPRPPRTLAVTAPPLARWNLAKPKKVQVQPPRSEQSWTAQQQSLQVVYAPPAPSGPPPAGSRAAASMATAHQAGTVPKQFVCSTGLDKIDQSAPVVTLKAHRSASSSRFLGLPPQAKQRFEA